ncbi:FAD-dependent monooxygenase [Geodermatophilus ruber]|uniref:2,4-dichlorophenol 6-monooxygenase n=1 Tax=Geodermatophilus ruber TaxID=504800 RepID=A0A1I4BQN5_9ACTN|nr:FAD-dependent monooxygenase [Geodermatophilus ruber]SFK70161.1 2,4-dichlorophenol 6-monooxygenase [Geodermatophilus ruber]
MNNAAQVVETDVLIVGAGPAGASAAALLSTYGIPNIVINKYRSVANTPRAHITNQRAMETLRDLGLEEVAAAASTPQALMGEHVWGTSLAGEELGRIRTWYTHPLAKAEHDLASPTAICDLPQHILEPILINAASDRGSQVRFNTEFIDLEQDADGVTTRVRDRITGAEYAIRSKYLIAADGGRSQIVSQLGLPLEGELGMANSINVWFKADLTHLVEHRPSDMYWFIQPGVGQQGMSIGVLRVIRTWNEWIAVGGYDPSGPVPELTDELGRQIAHEVIGDDSIDVEVISLSTWAVNHMYATDNMVGRVFAVGDAVHRHSPMNGLGSNTSIQDSYSLCWKLAHVLRGVAAPSLLETHRDERVPVGRQIVDRATRSNNLIPPLFMALGLPPTSGEEELRQAIETLADPSADARAARTAFRTAVDNSALCFGTHGVEMNQRYESSAVVPDGTPAPTAPRDEEIFYFPSTYPGRHLPHVWVTKDQKRVPIFDLCGKGAFTLLTGIRGEQWREAAAKAEAECGVRVNVRSIGRGCDYEDSYGDYARACEVEEDGALLVRPDHIIGWRAQDASGDPAARLIDACRQIFGRKPAGV